MIFVFVFLEPELSLKTKSLSLKYVNRENVFLYQKSLSLEEVSQ